jgi:AhpC/TSA family
MPESPSLPNSTGVKRHSNLKRRLFQITALVVLLYLFAMAGFAYAMRLPPERFSRVMMHVGPIPFLLFPFESMWKNARQGHVHVGDTAPDFTLPLLDHSSQVTLSSFRGSKPVVLVFGSYT